MVAKAKSVFGGGKGEHMRAAQIEGGIVTNFVEIGGFCSAFGNLYVDPKESEIGDLYNADTGEFSRPEPVEPPAEIPEE